MKPLVTVVIPSFNHSKYILKAIESVLGQDYENFELVVVDDGSIDETRDLLRSQSFDSRVSLILNEKNRGQSAALNQALQISRGEYICLLPSDDWYLSSKLSSQIAKFESADADVGVVYGRGYRYFSDLDSTISVELPMHRGWVLDKLVKDGNFVYPVTPMFRRECFDFARPDESYRAEGEAIYLKLAIKYKFDYVDEYVGVMRDHSYNTGKLSEMMYRDNVRYWTDFFKRADIPEDVKRLRSVPLARVHRLKGLEAIALDGRYAAGRSALLRAISHCPKLVFDHKVTGALVLSLLPRDFSNVLVKKFIKK